MGIARLLAKGWATVCIFAGAHALVRTLAGGAPLAQAIPASAIPVFLFGAMGLLFAAGYGLSSGHLLSRFKPVHVLPGFNEWVFIAFALVSFAAQVTRAQIASGVLDALEAALRFAVPAQRALENSLTRCSLDGHRALAAAVAWLLALIFLASALSHIRMQAALVRLERKRRIEPLGPTGIAFVLGVVAVIGIQFLYIGSIFRMLPCSALGGLGGNVLTGLAPLMLAYLVAAALTNLLATSPEHS
ncbi:MAG TPA: hypothetical protein VLC74_05660 [Rhizomicrobium sp.]|nr:hypothetical protein [Rhizomicrobium sp.]